MTALLHSQHEPGTASPTTARHTSPPVKPVRFTPRQRRTLRPTPGRRPRQHDALSPVRAESAARRRTFPDLAPVSLSLASVSVAETATPPQDEQQQRDPRAGSRLASSRGRTARPQFVSMKDGWLSSAVGLAVRGRERFGGGEQRSSLSPLQRRGPCEMGGSLRRRISKESRQAARRKRAPAGAKGSLRVSMCQIASVSFRERSIWATLGPRWRPRRLLVR